jgi:putative flavoprotein involved in K+ transport
LKETLETDMPEMHFKVAWPDGSEQDCYSPSYIIEEYLVEGAAYSVGDFLERTGLALNIASDRVRQKYGFACSSALDQLAQIREAADALKPEYKNGRVKVVEFRKHAPRDARAGTKAKKPTPKTHYPVVVIGAGQAGLSVSYYLAELGVKHIILERNKIAHSWREERWDSFCLVTPNWQCRLPGFPYHGDDPYGFMVKSEIVKYIEEYVAFFGPPVEEGVDVTSVSRSESGFEVVTSRETITADQVVLATGGYPIPIVPAFAGKLPPSIRQVHSSEYKNPAELPQGAVLVVGSGQSGAQIAEDLHLAGRKVHLAVGNAPRCARFYRGKDVVEWLEEMGYYALTLDNHPNKESIHEKTNHYVTGRDRGHDLDLRKFALEGMQLYGILEDADSSKLKFAPGLTRNLDEADAVYNRINQSIDEYIEKKNIEAPPPSVYQPLWRPEKETLEIDAIAEDITSVIWCIGFRTDYSWVHLPVFDVKGRPEHHRGVTSVPGLYFVGLPWLHTWGSGRFSGVAVDAHHIVGQIQAQFAQGQTEKHFELGALGS